MAWTTPIDWQDDVIYDESDFDEQISANMNYLKDKVDDGLIAVAEDSVDLSTSTPQVLMHTTFDINISKIVGTYTEASSADDPRSLAIARAIPGVMWWEPIAWITPEASKAKWYETEARLVHDTLESGHTLIAFVPHAKTGAGEILVSMEYSAKGEGD